jgi:hypothetical protein
MRPRGPATMLFFIVPVLLAMLVLAGCGGGGDQSQNGGSQGGDGSGKEKQGEAPRGNAARGNAPTVKIALGTIISAEPDRRKIILRPSTKVQGNKRMIFKVRGSTEISLNNKPAEMADVREGQQAQIQYVFVNDRNRARTVSLFSNGEGPGS